jgi:hypothetical protein
VKKPKPTHKKQLKRRHRARMARESVKRRKLVQLRFQLFCRELRVTTGWA